MAVANVHADFSTSRQTIRTLMEQVRAEYAEMPGLSITLPQAQRLWAVEQHTCQEALSRLVSRGVLRRTRNGRFIRA